MSTILLSPLSWWVAFATVYRATLCNKYKKAIVGRKIAELKIILPSGRSSTKNKLCGAYSECATPA